MLVGGRAPAAAVFLLWNILLMAGMTVATAVVVATGGPTGLVLIGSVGGILGAPFIGGTTMSSAAKLKQINEMECTVCYC